MDNGEMRLSGLIDGTDTPSEEELEVLREELLADAADPNRPKWRIISANEEPPAEAIFNPDSEAEPSIPLVTKIRRFLLSIFN